MYTQINILKVVKSVKIDEGSLMILSMRYGLDGARAKRVEEVAAEIGRPKSLIYYRLRKMKNLGILNERRELNRIEIVTANERK